jgi:hypothetical protein
MGFWKRINLWPKSEASWGSTPPKIKSDAPTAAEYYRDLLAQSRQQRSVATIPNGSGRQATDMMHELFTMATNQGLEIALFSGELQEAVYEPLVDDLEKFLAPKGRGGTEPKIRVLTEKDPAGLIANPFCEMLSRSPEAEILQASPIAKPMPHFMLVGLDAYRVEKDHGTMEAVGSFNDPGHVVTLLLKQRFDSAWEAARAAI